jgi:ubiquinone/menaquinone biosynthesis C-methylase UbiE
MAMHDLAQDLRATTSRDAAARQAFISELRRYILDDMAAAMRRSYESAVAPAFEHAHGHPPHTQDQVHAAMRSDTCFKFYSSIRYNAQEMVWRAVIPEAQGALPRILDAAERPQRPTGGTLLLDPGLRIPANVAGLDVHLMPGGYSPDASPLAGAVYDRGLAVFAAGLMGAQQDDIGLSMAHYVQTRFPHLRPTRILDCGATVGHNTLPWAQTFTDAEVHAIDVSAAVLAYAHARAESLGVPVHFCQMDATDLEYPDASFDIVFTSMFLHELPLADIRLFFSQARRVLRPGGLLLNMELPPNRQLSPYDQFYLDWDSYYNLEPYYRTFRDQDPEDLIVAGGFARQSYLQFVVPQFSYMPESEFSEAVRADCTVGQDTGRLSSGVQWFGFGAWKN